MSGGDLDGDEFFVTWEKELLSQKIRIQEPAVYDKNNVEVDAPP